MAASSVSINVMLAIHGKKTQAFDLYKPLRNYIVHHYSEREAQDAEDDLRAVQEMRLQVVAAQDALEARRDLLQKYFRALTVMESRFPISTEREHVNTVTFTWWDAFKNARKASQQNIHFEKAAIMFNLGAVQSQLGLNAERSTANGLKQACNCFQAAAGAYAYLRDNVAMKANPDLATPDISIECAGMLERLMLAQAQECFFEKVTAENKSSTLCARIAKQVGLFYEEAYAALVLPPLNQHFDKSWVSHVQLKAAQFHGEALYRVSLDLHAAEEIDKEIARLKAATTILADAKKQSKGVTGPLMDAVTKLELNVTRNLERANKENDRVYLMRVPHNDSLPAIQATPLVKSMNLDDALDPNKEKMFTGLVPDSSAKALSRYTEMVDDIIRTHNNKLQQESDVTRVRLKEMDLPDVLLALDGNIQLPEQLRDDVEAVQVEGATAALEQELQHLRELRKENERLLAETEGLLEKEERDDGQVRAQFGTRWTRPQSSSLTKNLKDRANGFASNLKQAGESDARIEKTIKDLEPLLSILKVQPIEAAIPPLAKPIVSVHGNEDQVAHGLRQLLNELEKVGSQRAGLEDALKSMKQKDNILPRLMTYSGSYEELFKKELAKYDAITADVQSNVARQEELLKLIKDQNDLFVQAFQLAEYRGARDKVVDQISRAAAKYRELRENMNEGVKFYITLQDAITALKQQCGDFVMTRDIQLSEMLEDLQRQVTSMTISGGNKPAGPGGYPSPYGAQPGPPQESAASNRPPPPAAAAALGGAATWAVRVCTVVVRRGRPGAAAQPRAAAYATTPPKRATPSWRGTAAFVPAVAAVPLPPLPAVGLWSVPVLPPPFAAPRTPFPRAPDRATVVWALDAPPLRRSVLYSRPTGVGVRVRRAATSVATATRPPRVPAMAGVWLPTAGAAEPASAAAAVWPAATVLCARRISLA
ncbi:Endosomal targeting BRO1-like domain-containing protein [Klebsormidium nitens]|uniref:Endosomal targeting BRO1-like domain-containing protein n=1 Tax=Klebsormidium nitens TaxID=105231 RepID=A0A1Y1HIG3_KLENI|nr:Endosomal targeting BRO1-like domain-containing protein [Klebsormidium nitens]|eukprot:GAQ78280.1 Endosomal targeting BRO1-like domain-containing protein [Klebsormidium nitens]